MDIELTVAEDKASTSSIDDVGFRRDIMPTRAVYREQVRIGMQNHKLVIVEVGFYRILYAKLMQAVSCAKSDYLICSSIDCYSGQIII